MITSEEFAVRVQLLRRKDPTNPLLPQLGQYSRIACVYLRHAMRGLEIDEEEARPQVQSIDEERGEWDDSPEMEELQMKKSGLYGRRFNLSNQLHEHKKDRHACANIVDQIAQIQLKIGKVQRQIMHLKRTGEVLEEVVEVEREYSGLALSRRERTVAQNARRWRDRIAREGMNQPDHVQKEWDDKLKAYERELESLRAQIREEAL